MKKTLQTTMLFLSTALVSCQTTQERRVEEMKEQAQVTYWQDQIRYNKDPKLTAAQRDSLITMLDNASLIVTDQSAADYTLLAASDKRMSGFIVKQGDTLAEVGYSQSVFIFNEEVAKTTGFASEYQTRDVVDLKNGMLVNTYTNRDGNNRPDSTTQTSTFQKKSAPKVL